MNRVLLRWGLLGVVALLLGGTWAVARAPDDEKPKNRRERLQQAMKRLEMLRKLMEANQGGQLLPDGFGLPMMGGFGAPRAVPEPRLGASLRSPSATLADQLDLPKNRGLVVADVAANSAAGKAGLKKHDVLLELNGKAVRSKRDDFGKLLADIQADTPVDAVVMRKGKKETIKGLSLPEAKAPPGLPEVGDLDVPNIPDVPGGLVPKVAPDGQTTTITRNNDEFTATQKKGKMSITVTGTIDQGKATVGKVVIDDGANGKKEFESLDKVPAEFKKRVEKLAELSAGGKKETR